AVPHYHHVPAGAVARSQRRPGVGHLHLQAGHHRLDADNAGLVVARLGTTHGVGGRRGGPYRHQERDHGYDDERSTRGAHGLTVNWVLSVTWLAKGAWSEATNSTRRGGGRGSRGGGCCG